MKYLLFLSFITLPSTLFSQSTAKRPFPWRDSIRYALGTIFPQVSPEEMQNSVETFYNYWKKRYIVQDSCHNSDSLVSQLDEGDSTINTSEAQGYGMVIVALMAGFDPTAKKTFDALYSYYKSHPSNATQPTSKFLMSWQALLSREAIKCDSLDDAAPDGDMDIAYSLLLAFYQWQDSSYLKAADSLLNGITRHEINPVTYSLLLSDDDQKKRGDHNYFVIRSSDFMPANFRIYRHHGSDSLRWDTVLQNNYKTLAALQHPVTGLVPNFAHNEPDHAPRPFEGKIDGEDHPPFYSHNACRVPWRVATDFIVNGNTDAKTFVAKINDWLIDTTGINRNNIHRKKDENVPGADPHNIAEGYKLNGDPITVKDYANFPVPSFICPFAVAAMVDAKYQKWLNTLWTFIVTFKNDGILDHGDEYYNNTIKMFTMIILSGNYWQPKEYNVQKQ